MTPAERLRRALHDAADALADLAEERAAPASAPKAPATVPNNDVARAFAQRELARQGWPKTPRRAG